MAKFDRRLIPNYVFAGATIGTFLWACAYSLTNWQSLSAQVSTMSPEQGVIIGGVGGSIITALLINVEKIYNFFYKKTPTNGVEDTKPAGT